MKKFVVVLGVALSFVLSAHSRADEEALSLATSIATTNSAEIATCEPNDPNAYVSFCHALPSEAECHANDDSCHWEQ